jgi:hypothetical protein
MSERALALGTRDALILYHAGMIAAHQGNDAQARQYLSDALTINGNRTLSAVGGTGGTAGAGGNAQLQSTVDADVAATRTLTLTLGTGDATISGAIGTTASLSALTITANDISLASIGGGSAGISGATSATAATNGGDTGSITFNGTTYNANAQTYTTPESCR